MAPSRKVAGGNYVKELEDLGMRFSEQLRRLREEKGLSQMAAADLAGVGIDTWSRLERPGTQEPRLSTLYKVAKALKINPRDLLPEQLPQNLTLQDELVEAVKHLDAETQEAFLKILRKQK